MNVFQGMDTKVAKPARFCAVLALLAMSLGSGSARAAGPAAPGVTPRTWNEGGKPSDGDEVMIPLSPKALNNLDLGLGVDGSPCHKGPSNWLLLGVGAAFAPVAYELGVMWHEGSHAAWASAFGAHVTGWYPYPKIIPGNGFVFGYTTWTGQMTDAQTALTFVAPKITDLTLLTAYTIMNETGNMPENKWAQLALNSLAIAAVVDLGHDVGSTNPYADVPQFYRYSHVNNSLPGRLIQGGLTLAGAVEVGHGIYRMFQPLPASGKTEKKDDAPKKATALSDFTVTPYIGSETVGVSGTF